MGQLGVSCPVTEYSVPRHSTPVKGEDSLAGVGVSDRSQERGLGDAVARWLHGVMREGEGTGKLALSKASKVSRATIDRLLSGQAEDVDQETLDKLAAALRVVPPTVVRRLELRSPAPRVATPLALLREAVALLERAERKLAGGRVTSSQRGAARDDADRQSRLTPPHGHRQQA